MEVESRPATIGLVYVSDDISDHNVGFCLGTDISPTLDKRVFFGSSDRLSLDIREIKPYTFHRRHHENDR